MASAQGAAARIAENLLGGQYTTRFSTVTVGTSVVEAVPQDPDRIHLLVFDSGSTDITLGFGLGLVAGQGILLLGNGASVSMNVRDDGDVVANRINAVGNVAGGQLSVIEVVLALRGKDEE